MSFDTRCYDLAKVFLSDHYVIPPEPIVRELSQVIQTTIEDFIEDSCPEQRRES